MTIVFFSTFSAAIKIRIFYITWSFIPESNIAHYILFINCLVMLNISHLVILDLLLKVIIIPFFIITFLLALISRSYLFCKMSWVAVLLVHAGLMVYRTERLHLWRSTEGCPSVFRYHWSAALTQEFCCALLVLVVPF